CEECVMSSSQSSTLICHQRIQPRERPYKCQECGKSFIMSDNLICHQKIHTGTRP
ncbi:ZN256 protein, partial [Toxostoma redivivum]|nr:ZN256 protein [Toxostoma redivivum]